MQRANYGIPPRRADTSTTAVPQVSEQPVAPAPPGGRFMDIASTQRPITSVNHPTPAQQAAVPAATTLAGTGPQKPLFSSAPQPQLASQSTGKVKAVRRNRLVSKIRLSVMIVAALLVVGGAARWLTAGSTANSLVAVGAVSRNDESTMIIQFTANDGQLHKFTTKSNAALVPGTAVEVAYRSGAPDTSARQVSVIKQARNLGMELLGTGLGLLIIAGIWALIARNRSRRQ